MSSNSKEVNQNDTCPVKRTNSIWKIDISGVIHWFTIIYHKVILLWEHYKSKLETALHNILQDTSKRRTKREDLATTTFTAPITPKKKKNRTMDNSD